MFTKKNLLLSLTTVSILSINLQAKENVNLDDIIVTAQKVEESVKDVPISLNVFDEYTIENKNIHSVQDLSSHVPSLYFFNLSDIGTASPTLRGIHSDYRTTSSSVAMYIDGIPTLVTSGYNTYLYDIERIEVLKGPQSTLYGKNAQAGVINIITRQPSNEFRGRISLELAEDNKRQTTFDISGPIINDKFFAGFAGRFYEKEGFIKNTYLNKTSNDRKSYSGRLNLKYLASDDLEFSFVVSKEKRRDGGGNASSVKYTNPYQVSFDLDEKSETDIDTSGFRMKYYFSENQSIETVTSYKNTSLTMIEDFDKSSNPNFKQHAFFPTQNKTISQELRYNQTDENYNLLLGLYLDKSEEETINEFDTAQGKIIYGNQKVDGKSLGIFTHVDYKLTDKLSILAGIRYDKDTKKLDNRITSVNEKDTLSEFSPKLALKYQLDKNILTYVNIAKGLKPGGYYVFAPLGEEYYAQESLYSYEIGLKSSFFDNRLNLNLALYYMDVSDKQIVVPISNLANYIKNAESATSKGIELELSYKLTNTLSVSSSFAYNKATFDDFKYKSLIFDQSYNVIGSQNVDNSGKYMPHTPKYTYSLGFEYRGYSGIYANAHLNGFGSFFIDDSNIYKRKPYSLVNTKIGYETEDYDIYLYGKNIFDENYDTKEHFGMGYMFLSKPREIGVQLVYRF